VIAVNGVGEARIGPTIERLRHAADAGADTTVRVALEVKERNGLGVERVLTTRMLDGDVLELLFAHHDIDQEQLACGQEFYRHWYRSGLAASGVIDPAKERVDGGAQEQQSDVQLFHLGKWQGMVRRLGQVHSRVMCDCVLIGHSLQAYGLAHSGRRSHERARDWAKARITAALEQLVLNELGPKRSRMAGHIAAGDRPNIIAHEETH